MDELAPPPTAATLLPELCLRVFGWLEARGVVMSMDDLDFSDDEPAAPVAKPEAAQLRAATLGGNGHGGRAEAGGKPCAAHERRGECEALRWPAALLQARSPPADRVRVPGR